MYKLLEACNYTKKNCISLLTAFFLAAVLFMLPVSAAPTHTEGDWLSRLRVLHGSTYGEELYDWLVQQANLSKSNRGALVSIRENENGVTQTPTDPRPCGSIR